MSSRSGDEIQNRSLGPRTSLRGRRNYKRTSRFECLERRELLAVAVWNNVVFPVDVNGNQPASVDPLDALVLINELNVPRLSDPLTGLLPKQTTVPQVGPYLDVNCDGRISPLDVLVVINHLNTFGSGGIGGFQSGGGTYASAACSPQLIEGTGFATELTRVLKVPSDNAILQIQFQTPAFDTTSRGQIRDAFEIEITDSAGRPVVLPYQSNRDAAYNWSEGLTPAYGTGTWSTTDSPSQDPIVSIDLTGLAIGTELHVSARLVNNDSDNGTNVIIRGFEFVEAPISTPGRTANSEARSLDIASFDITKLSNLSGIVQVDYGRTSLASDNNELIAELTITNIGSQAILGPLVLVLDKFSELESNSMQPDGILSDGRPFIDFTSRLNGGPLAPGQSIASREIRFLNNSGLRFTYQLGVYGRLNAEPSRFDSAPILSIAAKNNYGYRAHAVDEDDQPLNYSLINGPAEMSIDSMSGQIAWRTKTSDIGSHLVRVRATDPFGLFIEQSFEVEVLESLQNRPPNFTSTPVLDATASSGFELATVATGQGPIGIAVIGGIQGNRLVVANAQDQSIEVHNRGFADEFAEAFSVSTGEPKPNGLPLRSGTNVDLGLPPFLQAVDSNDVLGLDQGDFNGDGILDLAALTLRHESWINNATINRYTNEIVVMLGNGDGQFGKPAVVASYAGTGTRDFKNLRAADINGDGRLDLMCIDETGSSLIIILGRGDGRFENAASTTLAVGLNDFRLVDLDQDGNQDIVGRSSNWSRFGWMKGNSSGAFSSFIDIGPLHPGDSNGSDITIRPYQFADFNKDGHLDIIYARANESKLDILFNNGNETFSLAKSFDRANALVVYVADFTGDHQLDVVYSTSNSFDLTLLVGDGSGTNFVARNLNASVAAWPGNSAGNDTPIDIDQDGDLDLVIASSWSSPLELSHTYVLLNDSRGNFSSTGYTLPRLGGSFDELTALGEGSVAGALVGDYNRDGVLDIATFTNTNDFNGVGIAMGTRPGEFDANPTIPFTNVSLFNSAYPGDFNGDGIQDVFSMPAGDMRLGKGDGTFRAPFPAIPRRSNQASTARVDDFNRDGILDIVFYLGGGSFYSAAMGNGDGTFDITFQLKTDTFYEPTTIQSGDFNNDGYLDFVARFPVEKVLDVYLYDPLKPGTFSRSERMNLNGNGVLARGFGGAVTVADFNRDGKMDLAIVDQLESIGEPKKLMTFAGRGNGTFQLINEQFDYNDNLGIGSNYPNFLKSGDINEDGFQDVVTFSVSSIVTHLGKGDGTFYSPDFLPENGCTGGISCYADHDWGHLVDLDGDRHLDLVYATHSVGNLTVRLGNGDGTFDPPAVWDTPEQPGSLQFADIDHDGHLDIVHSSGGVEPFASVYYGARDGLVDMVAADLNGDGNQEIVAVNNSNDRLKLFVGDNLGQLTRTPDLQTGRAPMAVAVADLDGDQKLEIITANRTSRSISIFTGSLTSGYVDVEYPVGKGPIDIATGNFNGDQYVDIFVLDDTANAVWILAGKAAGLFADPVAIALGDRPGKLLVQDATGDNLIDIVVTLPDTNRLLILTGDGISFGNPLYVPLASSPTDVAVVDLNADQLPDLIASLPDLDRVSILYARGGGQYARAQQVSVGDQPSTLTVSDINKDGRPDILVTNRGDDTATIIYNRFDPNEVYRYDADAVDPDGDLLEFRVADGPGGLYIHSETGTVFWAASPDQVGQHRVVLEASDGHGGLATQTFFIDVEPAQANSLPLIATTPVTTIGGGEKFKYQVQAIDQDRETLRYRLLDGPSGATIDATSGLLEWDGTNDQAFQFNPYNSSGYVQVPSDPSLKPANITVEGWYQFHPTTPSAANQVMIDMSGPGNLRAYSLYTTKAGKLVLELDQTNLALDVKLEGNFVPTLERWYHFAFTFDDGSGELSIFVDGELFASRVTDKSLIYGDGDLYLGTNSSSNRPHVSIDNFRIWNIARTSSQIVEGLGRQYDGNTNLVLDYRFEDRVAIGIRDHSPASNDGYRMGTLPPIVASGLADMGTHRFVVGVEDGRGGYDTQSFEVNVLPELRGSIAGKLFEDANRDGIKGVGEIALKAWVLYLDHNGNAYPDPDETVAITDANGNYQFTSLLPGSYPVRVVPVAGYSSVGLATISVKANRATTLDRAIEISALGQIQGLLRTEGNLPIANWRVFADLDMDDLLDDNEPVAITDSKGSYAIAGLSAGEYRIRTSLPAGWSDVAGNDGLLVSLSQNMISASNNFTLRPTNSSVTGGVQFVTAPATKVEARQVFRYAPLAKNLNNTSIIYDLSLAPVGMAIDSVSGMIAWRPTIDQIGEHSVVVRATDVTGSIALHDFQLSVTSPNSAPVFVAEPPAKAYVGSAAVHDFAAQDAESNSLTFSIISGPSGATIDPALGRFRWTPTANDVGQVGLTIAVKDEGNNLTTQSYIFDVASNAPTALPLLIQLPRISAAIGHEYLSQLRATDRLLRPVTWTLVAGPRGLAVDADGTVRWTPTSAELGSQTVHLLATTTDGATQGVEIKIEVLGWLTNSVPEITSTPSLSAVAGRTYRYRAQVVDADRDDISFSLLSAPPGMSIHPKLGLIDWTPALDQLGSVGVTLQVTDANGATATQSFSLRVGRTGGPPLIISISSTEAYVGRGYLHTILTNDQEGDTLLYRLLSAPLGMKIETTTGEISWTPTQNQIGQQAVAIEVSDGTGGATTQSFVIRVRDGVPNQPPQIVGHAPRFGTVGTAFSHTLQAVDPESGTISYRLGRGPAGMTIDASTGVVVWTPSMGQVGKSIVTLVATDVGGASALESFELDVLAENRNPTIFSNAPLEVPARALFRYDVIARDSDLDLLRYRLLVAPVGASIDAFGTILWSTRTDLIGSHDFQVLVSDPRGGEATQSFQLNVIEDILPPKVSLIAGPNRERVLPWHGPLTLYAKAIDNVAVASLTVTINGQEIVLDASGQATFTFEKWGFTRLDAIAKAVDTNGNVTEKSIAFGYSIPEGWAGAGDVIPQAMINSPSEASEVTGLVSIFGTASHASFGSYRLSYRRMDQIQFTEFYQSSVPVVNGQLGVWDTTLLENDEYVIRLEVTTSAGVLKVFDCTVGLSGVLKLGNFQLSFTDMVIPVAGIPLEITRVYDTLRADRDGDFGYGWRLEYRNTDLRVGLPKSGLEDVGIYTPFHTGVKVYLNVPGQGRQGFTFTPIIRVLPGFGGTGLVIATPRFTPDRGNTNTLTVRSGNLFANESGDLYATGGIPWNPASPDFGGYTLTTGEGIKYRIVGETGQLTNATDRNGNEITFSESGLSSNNGVVVSIQRDANGRISSIVDPTGNSIQYSYSAFGDLIKVSDRENNTTQFEYHPSRLHFVDKMIDSLGRNAARVDYTVDGRLAQLVNANGQAVSVSFDPANYLVTSTDPLGFDTITEYDNEGKVVSQRNPLGGVSQWKYDARGRLVKFTDALGRETQTRYDSAGNLYQTVNALGETVQTNYSATGELMAVSDALGNTTRFEYDQHGNLTRKTIASGATTSWVNDARGLVTETTGPRGERSTFGYNRSGRLTEMKDADGNEFSSSLNDNGQVVSEHGEIESKFGTSTVNWSYQYNKNGDATSITNPLGTKTTLDVDPMGKIIHSVAPDGTSQSFTWDANGQQTGIVASNGGPLQVQRNAIGREVMATLPTGEVITHEYDANGRRTKTTVAGKTSREVVLDAVGQEISNSNHGNQGETRTYDAAGNLSEIKFSDGTSLRLTYDMAGRLTSTVDGYGRLTRHTYDISGRLLSTTNAVGQVESTVYDLSGNAIEKTDFAGQTWRYQYNSSNKLTVAQNGKGEKTRYYYNGLGQLESVTDALGRSTSFAYDGTGQRIETKLPGGESQTFVYDNTGRVVSITDFLGQPTRFSYNSLGQLDFIGRVDGDERHSHSSDGRVVELADTRGTTRITRDFIGNLVSWTGPNQIAVNNAYDDAGRATTIETSNGKTLRQYANEYQLNRIVDPQGREIDFDFGLSGQSVEIDFDRSVHETRSFDDLGRTVSISYAHNGNVLLRLDYDRGDSGRVQQIRENTGRVVSYEYDSLGRLAVERTLDSGITNTSKFAYDAAGNLIERTTNGVVQKFLVDSNDRLLADDFWTYQYDANGNLERRVNPAATEAYAYDSRNRVISITRSGAGSFAITYRYDVDGLLAERHERGETVRYVWDRSSALAQLLETRNGQGQLIKRFESDGTAIRQETNATGEVKIYLTDNQFSVRGFVDQNGNLVQTATRDSHGRLVGGSESDIGFIGGIVDPTTHLVFLRSRWYSPELARFLTTDSAPVDNRDSGSINRYTYALNDPVNRVDLNGQISSLIEQLTVVRVQAALFAVGVVGSTANGGSLFSLPKVFKHLFDNPTGGGAGVNLVFGGVEGIFFPREFHAAVFGYFAGQAGFATPDAIAVPLYAFGVFDAPRPDSYKGFAWGISAGTLFGLSSELVAGTSNGSVFLSWSPTPTFYANEGTGQYISTDEHANVSNPSRYEPRFAHTIGATPIGLGTSYSLSVSYYFLLLDIAEKDGKLGASTILDRFLRSSNQTF